MKKSISSATNAPTVPLVRSRSSTAGVVIARWVTSMPTMVVSMPAWKTACAASGSAQMLNSAAGVWFPSAIAPPMRTMRSTFAPPVRSSSSATFVSGPVGTRVTGMPLAVIMRSRNDTACSLARRPLRRRRGGPSRPVSPWTCEATMSSRRSGRCSPAATGMSRAPRGRGRAARWQSSSRASGCRTPSSRRGDRSPGSQARAGARSRRRAPGRSRG